MFKKSVLKRSMLKRIGILAFVLGAGALLQPAAALAADRAHGNDGFGQRNEMRVVEQNRVQVRRYDDRGDRDRDRVVRRDERVIVRTGPQYYVADPNCGR